jgi:hypothetical protein
MTTIQITLPDELAKEAEQAGLLSPESLEQLLREKLRAQSFDQLFAEMDRQSCQRSALHVSGRDCR